VSRNRTHFVSFLSTMAHVSGDNEAQTSDKTSGRANPVNKTRRQSHCPYVYENKLTFRLELADEPPFVPVHPRGAPVGAAGAQ
jgi:hypothetical protein